MSEEKTDFHLVDEQPSSKKDWEISELYSKAWNIVKKHKVTWIFGAAVAATAMGSSGNFNSSSSGNSESIQKLFNGGLPEASSSAEMSKVLGESINPFQQLFSEIIQRIPIYYYFILAGEILFMILLAIIITIIYRAWAHASLIASVDNAYKHSKTSISQASEAGFKHFKSFVWLDIVPSLVIFIVSLIYVGVLFLGIIADNTALNLISLVIGVFGLFVLLYFILLTTVAVIWAYREVAISNLNARTAFSNGFKIAKKKIGASLILGFINNITSLIITVIPIMIILGFGTVAAITYVTTKQISYLWIGLTVMSILIILPIIVLISAIIQAFKASVWTIAYDKIKGKYTNE